MKKTRLFVLVIFILVTTGVFFFKKFWPSSTKDSSPLNNISDFGDANSEENHNNPAPIPRDQRESKAHDDYVFDKLAFELSKKICKQEREELWELFKSPTKLPEDGQIPEGGILLEESKITLEPSKALALLKKVSNSKCSSLRKGNAQKLIHLKLDENNYRDFWDAFNLVLAEYGLATDALIKKSIIALNKASPDEAKALRDAILQSLKIVINDSSDFVHLIGVINSLKLLKERDLIGGMRGYQIDALQKEFAIAFEESIARARLINQKYLPSDLKLRMAQSEKEMVDSYGYEGTRAMLEDQARVFETVQVFVKKLNDLIK